MSWLQHRRFQRWLVQHFHRMLDPAREKALRRHLNGCSQCRVAYMTLCYVEAQQGDAARQRHRRLQSALFGPHQAAPARFWKPLVGACVAVAAVVAMVLLVVQPQGGEGLRVKGEEPPDPSRYVNVHLFRRPPGRQLQPVKDSINRGDSLAFAYTNQSQEGFDRLLIFGVDERFTVYWYYPAWTDPADNPTAIEIQQGSGVELPDEVDHDYEGTRLRLFALFTHKRALTVQRIEQLVQGLRDQGAEIETLKRFPLEEAGQHTLLLEIEGPTRMHQRGKNR